MKMLDCIPDDPEIAVVETVSALYAYKRAPQESMILYPRPINGCFNDLAIWLQRSRNNERENKYARYMIADLEKVSGETGMDWPDELGLICEDMRRMEREKGEEAELRIVSEGGYPAEVYKFHQDGGSIKTVRSRELGRIMCCYNSPTTEGLLTHDAKRAEVNNGSMLSARFRPVSEDKPFRIGVGDIWRQVCMDTGGRAFIHRAVQIDASNPGHPWEGPRPWNPPRMLAVC